MLKKPKFECKWEILEFLRKKIVEPNNWFFFFRPFFFPSFVHIVLMIIVSRYIV
jgi:hypothetical protein